jgi:hypothetical protein
MPSTLDPGIGEGQIPRGQTDLLDRLGLEKIVLDLNLEQRVGRGWRDGLRRRLLGLAPTAKDHVTPSLSQLP